MPNRGRRIIVMLIPAAFVPDALIEGRAPGAPAPPSAGWRQRDAKPRR
jgi:hypothetical protein